MCKNQPLISRSLFTPGGQHTDRQCKGSCSTTPNPEEQGTTAGADRCLQHGTHTGTKYTQDTPPFI